MSEQVFKVERFKRDARGRKFRCSTGTAARCS
jgi:hypothetical protein